MEQRYQKRIAVGYKAEMFCSSKHYEGVIENLSPTGVNILIYSAVPETGFKPGDIIELKFEPCPGQTVSFMCRVVWSKETLPHRLTTRLGMEIVDPSWDKYGFVI